MEIIKKYIIQQTIIKNMNNNQITFFNSIISDIDKTHNKEEKKMKEEILQQLLMHYRLYKVNKLWMMSWMLINNLSWMFYII